MAVAANTKLLVHWNGADGATATTDEVGTHTIEAAQFINTAELDTAYSRFGTASLLLDGDSDYISIADHNDFDLNGTGDFCVEGVYRWASVAATSIISGTTNSAATDSGWLFEWNQSSTRLNFYATSGVGSWDVMEVYSAGWTPTINIQYHVAVERLSGVIEFYVDGVNKAATVNSGDDVTSIPTSSNPFTIGELKGGYGYHNGWVDEYRLSHAARRAGDFNGSAPTWPYATPKAKYSRGYIIC